MSWPLWGCLSVIQISSLAMATIWHRYQGSFTSLLSSCWTYGPAPSSVHSLLEVEHCWPLSLPTFLCLLYQSAMFCSKFWKLLRCNYSDTLWSVNEGLVARPLALPTQILCGSLFMVNFILVHSTLSAEWPLGLCSSTLCKDLCSWNGYKVYVHCVTSALNDWLIPSLRKLHTRNQITTQLKVFVLNEPTNARYITLFQFEYFVQSLLVVFKAWQSPGQWQQRK